MKAFLYLFCLLTILSCNNSDHKKNTGNPVKTDTLSYKEKLAIRANELYQQDKFAEAISCYDTLISIDSTKGGYYFKRAYSQSLLLNTGGAIADYLKSIDRNYSEKEKSFLNLGILYHLNKKFDSALYFFNECLKLNPESETARQLRLEALEKLRNR